MSTLEQIRQRPVLIISILGVALLLFILTAVDARRNCSPTTTQWPRWTARKSTTLNSRNAWSRFSRTTRTKAITTLTATSFRPKCSRK